MIPTLRKRLLLVFAAMVGMTVLPAQPAEAQNVRDAVRYFANRYRDGEWDNRRVYREPVYGRQQTYRYDPLPYSYDMPLYDAPYGEYPGGYYADVRQYDGFTDVEFVEQLYRDVLEREPDDIGVDHWLWELRRGMPREAVAWGFWTSRERRLLDQGWNRERFNDR